ncbi:MAG: hypothetical protein M3352_08870 [Bacteroidota bacterium]|nr:hypothetical protein [Bacteroidota bacterium]
MTVLTVTIKKKKAIKTLEELRANDLIDFTQTNSPQQTHIKKDRIKTHLASEKVLAKDWITKKEDAAWQDL